MSKEELRERFDELEKEGREISAEEVYLNHMKSTVNDDGESSRSAEMHSMFNRLWTSLQAKIAVFNKKCREFEMDLYAYEAAM